MLQRHAVFHYNFNWEITIFFLAVILGATLRLFLSTLGHNYDVESWTIVADIMAKGKSVYATTERHNYGPVLFYIFEGVRRIQFLLSFFKHPEAFHIILAAFLSVVDASIAWMLMRKENIFVAVLFMLNPVLILITGYHSQVDHVAIGFAFASWLLINQSPVGIFRLCFSAILLGISLMVKHDFIFFPIWLLFYEPLGNIWKRLFYSVMAWGIFLGGFLPWMGDPASRNGIIRNVFLYNSWEGNSFLARIPLFFFPADVYQRILWFLPISCVKSFFILGMVLSGIYIMRSCPKESFYLYLVCLLVFTSTVANQYLAIPAMACAYFWRSKWVWIYLFISTCFLLGFTGNTDNLNILPFFRHERYGGSWSYIHCQIWLVIFLFEVFTQMFYKVYVPQCHQKQGVFPANIAGGD